MARRQSGFWRTRSFSRTRIERKSGWTSASLPLPAEVMPQNDRTPLVNQRLRRGWCPPWGPIRMTRLIEQDGERLPPSKQTCHRPDHRTPFQRLADCSPQQRSQRAPRACPIEPNRAPPSQFFAFVRESLVKVADHSLRSGSRGKRSEQDFRDFGGSRFSAFRGIKSISQWILSDGYDKSASNGGFLLTCCREYSLKILTQYLYLSV